jgi:hypothetical protein
MRALDHSLVYAAQKFITAENVHHVNTWIFCYVMSPPDSPLQRRYEQFLREFVAIQRAMLADRLQEKRPGARNQLAS